MPNLENTYAKGGSGQSSELDPRLQFDGEEESNSVELNDIEF